MGQWKTTSKSTDGHVKDMTEVSYSVEKETNINKSISACMADKAVNDN